MLQSDLPSHSNYAIHSFGYPTIIFNSIPL